MNNTKKYLLINIINYIIWVLLLTIGSYLFTVLDNEAPGGITLGLSTIIFGIIVPFHLKKTNINNYKFLPNKKNIIKTLLITIIFFCICLFVFPSGILGTKETYKFLSNIPNFEIIISTFSFLLFSAITYGFIFWGGLLFAVKNYSNKFIAVIITSILFSIYHFSQYQFIPITINFFTLMFLWSLILTSLTFINNSVLPTIVIHQFGQFVYFSSSNNNPFAEINNSIYNFIMLGSIFIIYILIFKTKRKYVFKDNKRP